jgi:hypothetical protein
MVSLGIGFDVQFLQIGANVESISLILSPMRWKFDTKSKRVFFASFANASRPSRLRAFDRKGRKEVPQRS